MQIRIKAFGISRDILGTSDLDFKIPEGTNINELLTLLQAHFPKLSELNSLQVAVNEDYVENDTVIKSQDEVALVPPVSGG